jgi:pyruvate dehydrogenase E2 component (dihydrolipoamide acetyltransferase)
MADVIMPKMGDAMTEGVLVQWLKQDGEAVKAGDVIAEIQTDKSNVEIEAEETGALHVQAKAGETIPVGQTIAVIGSSAVPTAQKVAAASSSSSAKASEGVGTSAEQPPKRPQPIPPAPAPSSNGATRERVKASPLARRVAKERGLDIAQISGTGPQGRIIEADVLAFVPSEVSRPPALAERQALQTPMASLPPTELSAMRKVIARRMVESKTTIPHFYITTEVDMAAATALREQLNSYDEALPKISFNDMIVKASALALQKVPAVNVSFKNNQIQPGNGVHVGIAVALDEGLIVPVVRDADTLPLRRLAKTGRDLIKKARDKKLQPTDYTGGTFTVSNLGSFDVTEFQAIIDPSQGAILAVASIVKKAVALDDDTIVVRPRMNLTFSGDHRVMDGATGARFLQEVKRLLQNPLSLLEG